MFVLLEHGLHSLRVQASFHSLVCTMFYKNAYLLVRDMHFVVKLQKLTLFPTFQVKKTLIFYLKKQRCLANIALLFIYSFDIQEVIFIQYLLPRDLQNAKRIDHKNNGAILYKYWRLYCLHYLFITNLIFFLL